MLTQLEILNAKAKEKPYKLRDGDGLHLLIQPNGSKLWRLRYSFNGKENMLTFGSFPEVTLLDAREKRANARRLLAQGTDPSQHRKQEKLAALSASKNTFGAVVKEYLERLRETGRAEITVEKNAWLLETLAAPLTNRPNVQINPAELLDLLKKISPPQRGHFRPLYARFLCCIPPHHCPRERRVTTRVATRTELR